MGSRSRRTQTLRWERVGGGRFSWRQSAARVSLTTDATAPVNVLDHLAEPTVAIGEAHRVLGRGGILIAATASRHDSPELAEVWQPPPSSFDAEDGPRLVASVFGQVRVERWDVLLVRLPDTDAVRDYLMARFVAPEAAAATAERVAAPLAVTKRGAVIYARK
jgi:SAM-dependent methyltransferase